MANDSANSRPPDSRANLPLREAQLLAATVGDRQPLNNTIYLAPYDPNWPMVYASLKHQICEILGEKVLALEHVGSTSIPGLAAKPIIDMVLVVADSRDEAAYVRPLEQQGYTLRIREPDWFEHRLLKSPKIDSNLHVFSTGCEEIAQMLLFRNWLRTHADDRWRYEQKKRELAAQTWQYTQNYADAKSDIVQEILAKARLGEPHLG